MKGWGDVESQISELLGKVEYLEKLINTIQNNIISNIELTWTILSVVVATAGVALYALSKVWVNKRVDEELPKVIRDNPPVFYFKGVLSKVQTVQDDNGGCYSQGIIDLDIEKYNIKDIKFPMQLDLFYYERKNFRITNKEFSTISEELEVKVKLDYYNASISDHGIKIWYKDPFGIVSTNNILWTLQILNPKYSSHMNRND